MTIEKPKILNGTKLEPFSSKKESNKKITKGNKIGEVIESFWPSNTNKTNVKAKNAQNKKLTIKLETNGEEKRKILLKLENSNSHLGTQNYILLSELLKEFFNSNDT